MKQAAVTLLIIMIMFSCEEDEGLNEQLKSNGLQLEQIVSPKYYFNAQHVYGEYSGTFYVAQVGNVYYGSYDKGENWENLSLHGVDDIFYISSKGRIIYENTAGNKMLYSPEKKIMFSDQGSQSKYYLDEEDNVYYTKLSLNELFIAPSGEEFWQKIEVPENFGFSVIDVMPGGGIAFINMGANKTIFEYHPDTESWNTFTFTTSRSLDMDKIYIGQDGNYYLGDQYGVDKITRKGNVTSFEFPDTIQYYLNPTDIKVAENGNMYVSLAGYGRKTYYYQFIQGKWKQFEHAISGLSESLVQTKSVIIGDIWIFPGYSYTEDLIKGISFLDLETETIQIKGNKSNAVTPPLAFKTRSGKILLKRPENNTLYIYKSEAYQKTSIQDALDIFEDDNGQLFILGTDALYRADENLDNIQKTEDFFSSDFDLRNGSPDYFEMQQLNDGSYLLIATNEYTYNVGGTGFNFTNYKMFLYTSQDGMNWTAHPDKSKKTGYPSSIDKNGVIYFKQVSNYAGQSTVVTKQKSEDFGETYNNIEGTIPTHVSSNNLLLNFERVNGTYSRGTFYLNNGNKWEEYTLNMKENIDIKGININANDELIFTTSEGVSISNITFNF